MAAFSNGQQTIPALFLAIMENQEKMSALLYEIAELGISGPRASEYWTLRYDMQDLRRATEKALAWNTDKGNVG